MSDTLIGILVGLATLVVAFLAGRKNQKDKQALEQANKDAETSKLAEAIRKANDSIPDNDLRKWMRDNAEK
jgi:hypothetical protein